MMGFVLRTLMFFAVMMGAAAVSSPHEESRRIMRKVGDVKAAALRSDDVSPDVGKENPLQTTFEAMVKAQSPENIDIGNGNDCRTVFVRGRQSAGMCHPGKNHLRVSDAAQCEKAAVRNGVAYKGLTPDESHETAPKGCFTDGVSVFFNGHETQICGDEEGQNPCTGTPICWTHRYLLGAGNSQGLQDQGCPESYLAIKNEQSCRAAVSCLGNQPAPQMRIGEEFRELITTNFGEKAFSDLVDNKHKEFVAWCFVNEKDTNYYFNDVTSLHKKAGALINQPTGYPQCIHKCHSGGSAKHPECW